MKNQCQHLTMTQRNELLKLLQKFEELFDGTLDTRETDLAAFVHVDDSTKGRYDIILGRDLLT